MNNLHQDAQQVHANEHACDDLIPLDIPSTQQNNIYKDSSNSNALDLCLFVEQANAFNGTSQASQAFISHSYAPFNSVNNLQQQAEQVHANEHACDGLIPLDIPQMYLPILDLNYYNLFEFDVVEQEPSMSLQVEEAATSIESIQYTSLTNVDVDKDDFIRGWINNLISE